MPGVEAGKAKLDLGKAKGATVCAVLWSGCWELGESGPAPQAGEPQPPDF